LTDPLCTCTHVKSWHSTAPATSSRIRSGWAVCSGRHPSYLVIAKNGDRVERQGRFCKCQGYREGLGQGSTAPKSTQHERDELRGLYNYDLADDGERIKIEQWFEFYPQNPALWAIFQRFTLEAVDSGRKNFGGFYVINRIRWFSLVESKGDPFKISNNWSPFLTRLFHEAHHEHSDFFRCHKAAADFVYWDKFLKRFGA